jgi:hypothetical protein
MLVESLIISGRPPTAELGEVDHRGIDVDLLDLAGGEAPTGNDQFDEVVRINAHHWARCGRPVSAETVRKHLRVGADRARELTCAVRAADAAAVTRGVAVAIE